MPGWFSNFSSYLNSKHLKHILLAGTMVILIFVILLASFSGTFSKEIHKEVAELRDPNLDLKLVHVIFRHGARTPADTYPNDPYLNETFFPFGWGQLTNVGKQQMYELGEYLRSRYGQFLGELWIPKELHAQPTGVDRTKMSLQLVLAGLFPPASTELNWSPKLNWQPIPFSYEELDNDKLLLVRQPCPRYHEELKRVFDNDLKVELDANQPLYKELSNITGWNIKNPDDVQSLYSTLKAEEEFGLQLPSWTKAYYPKNLQEITDQSYIYNAHNDLLKRLKGGVFLKKAIEDWEKKMMDDLKLKILVFAGHDSTVTNILSAFKVWEKQFPDYATTALIEFSQHKETKEFGVEIFLRKSSKELQQLQIEGCKSRFCPLNELKILLKNVIPEDWTAECNNSTFVPPPPSGP